MLAIIKGHPTKTPEELAQYLLLGIVYKTNIYEWIEAMWDQDKGQYVEVPDNNYSHPNKSFWSGGILFNPAREINGKHEIKTGTIVELRMGSFFQEQDGQTKNMYWDFTFGSPQFYSFSPLEDFIPRSCIGKTGDELRFQRLLVNINYASGYVYPLADPQSTYFNNKNLAPLLSYGCIIKPDLSKSDYSANYGRAQWDENYSIKSPAQGTYDGAYVIESIEDTKITTAIPTDANFEPNNEAKLKIQINGADHNYPDGGGQATYIVVKNNTSTTFKSGEPFPVVWSPNLYTWNPLVYNAGSGDFSVYKATGVCVTGTEINEVKNKYSVMGVGAGLKATSTGTGEFILGLSLKVNDLESSPIYGNSLVFGSGFSVSQSGLCGISVTYSGGNGSGINVNGAGPYTNLNFITGLVVTPSASGVDISAIPSSGGSGVRINGLGPYDNFNLCAKCFTTNPVSSGLDVCLNGTPGEYDYVNNIQYSDGGTNGVLMWDKRRLIINECGMVSGSILVESAHQMTIWSSI